MADEPKVDAERIDAMFNMAKKKKKKKDKKEKKPKKDKKEKKDKKPSGDDSVAAGAGAGAGAGVTSADTAAAVSSAPEEDVTYDDMLARIYGLLHKHNPELTQRKRTKLKPPQVYRVGSTRTCWANFTQICNMMHRNPEHCLSFVLAELGTTGSIDGSQRLMLRGRYVPKYMESLLRKYINEYVTCSMCRSLNTTLTKDQVTRLHFMKCANCGSTRSVVPIKAGFHAVARGERRKARHK